MKSIARSVLAVLAGMIAGMVITLLVQGVNSAIHRPVTPPSSDTAALKQAIKQWLETAPVAALLVVVASWQCGAFVGGAVSAWIAGRARLVHAGINGGLVLLTTILNCFVVLDIHPLWMEIAGVVLPIPVGGLLVSPKRKRGESSPSPTG